MAQVVKWSVAALATVSAFSLATWICGAILLPIVMHDPDTRWGIASGVGVAAAALAALWGHAFATRPESEHRSPQVSASATMPEPIKNVIAGDAHGPVIQARDLFGPVVFGDQPGAAPRGSDDDQTHPLQ